MNYLSSLHQWFGEFKILASFVHTAEDLTFSTDLLGWDFVLTGLSLTMVSSRAL